MAEPKSLLDRIGGALKGEEKKAEVEAGAKKIVQAVPAQIEQQTQRAAEAAEAKAAEVKQAAAAKLESQVADLRSQLAKKEYEAAELKGSLVSKERQWMAKERELSGKVAELEASLKAAQAEVETLRAQAVPAARSIAAEIPARTHVVKAGDSLSAIAQAVYGNAARWPDIFEANKDKIKDPKLIRPGQELRIP